MKEGMESRRRRLSLASNLNSQRGRLSLIIFQLRTSRHLLFQIIHESLFSAPIHSDNLVDLLETEN